MGEVLNKYYFLTDSKTHSPSEAYKKLKELYGNKLFVEPEEGIAAGYEVGKVIMTATNFKKDPGPNFHIIGEKKGVEKLIKELENEKFFYFKEIKNKK